MMKIDNPAHLPEVQRIDRLEEPYVKAGIMVPNEYIGAVMELCQNKRGIYKDMHYIDAHRNTLEYEIPLGEIVFDFFDKLKSCTKGYASLDYEISEYKKSDLVKMDILLNGELIDALSIIVHRDFAYARGNACFQFGFCFFVQCRWGIKLTQSSD